MYINQLSISTKIARSGLAGSVLEYQLHTSIIQRTKAQDSDGRKTEKLGRVANVEFIYNIRSRGCEHHDTCISYTSFAVPDWLMTGSVARGLCYSPRPMCLIF